MGIKHLQFSEAVRNGSHSLPAQLVLIILQLLKVGEVSRHDKCSLVTVAVVAYVADNLTDVQKGELEPAECQQPSLGNIGIV